MNNWFLAKVKYEKVKEDGKQGKVTEQYLVDAISFTEAEARTIEQVSPFIDGEFKVVGLNPMNINEIFNSEDDLDDKWYKVKCNHISIDEVSGKEKKTPYHYLVAADSTATAEKYFHARMKGTLADYKIEGIVETKILDIYFYNLEKETEETR